MIKVTTEGDVEGRTKKTVGYFEGTTEQVAEYLVRNSIKPLYYFKFAPVKTVDVSKLRPIYVDYVVQDRHGNVSFSINKQKEPELQEIKLKNSIKEKLTPEELKFLGL